MKKKKNYYQKLKTHQKNKKNYIFIFCLYILFSYTNEMKCTFSQGKIYINFFLVDRA